MMPVIYRMFTELWQKRRLDTQRVFLYKACQSGTHKQHLVSPASVLELRTRGVGHMSQRMHRVEPEDSDIRCAACDLSGNTVITLDAVSSCAETVLVFSQRARSSVG
jgi:hypothetical protein